jgi:cobalt/nickel transport system ATP-binding protein
VNGAALELDGVRVLRGADGDRRVAIEHVSLAVPAGERVFLLGPNGAGKTSLLLALVGAVPFEGRITVGGTAVARETLDDVRRRVGFVFADPSDQFFLDEVWEEVAFGPRDRGLDAKAVERRVDSALAAVGLSGHLGRSPLALSLGEQRRLAIATALALEPEVLLLDEPTASLDPRARRVVLDVLRGLSATLIVATHDLDAALALGGRAVLVQGGSVVGDGRTADLLVDEAALEAAGLELPLGVAARREPRSAGNAT